MKKKNMNCTIYNNRYNITIMLDNIYNWFTNPSGASQQSPQDTAPIPEPTEPTITITSHGNKIIEEYDEPNKPVPFNDETEDKCYSTIISILEKKKELNTEQTPMLYYIDAFAHSPDDLQNKHKGKIYTGRNKEEVLLSADKNGFIRDELMSFVEMCEELFNPDHKMTYQDFINYMCTQAFDVNWFNEDVRPRFIPCEMV